jgi:uncharacterized protein YigE (DUF2233 family)
MIRNYKIVFVLIIACIVTGFCVFNSNQDENFVVYKPDLKKYQLELFYKNSKNQNIASLGNLLKMITSKKGKLLFATNGGIYKKDFTPQGLLIQNFKTISPLDTLSSDGNFYLQPNGVFYITKDNQGFICKTEDFRANVDIKHATQSGPMLVIDGKMHPAFKKGSANINIRNGVGVLPNDQLVFVMSKTEINFYDFATYFKELGCKNALYLDGFVSRTYLPEQNWKQFDGNFGVIIGVVKK